VGLSGREHHTFAARGFVLGIKAVSGRGDVFKAGGRVVKNVTGYDLPRGLAGSFGTLAVATEITLKVLPRAEISVTLILENLDPFRAAEALCTAMGAPVDVSGAAHLPPGAAKTQGFATAITALRLEGFAPSVTERYERLALMLKSFTSAVLFWSPGVCGQNFKDADQFFSRAAQKSGDGGGGKDSPRLRPLRLLHRDLPHLRAAWRRT